MTATLQKITPFLWFDHEAEDAARFYTSVFENSRIETITRYDAAGPGPAGSVMTVSFELAGQKFVALNGRPGFEFNMAVSFVVNCETQQEVDEMWARLLADGGNEIDCGWLKDKYDLCWQVVPTVLFEFIADQNVERKQRVMQAMFQMKKLDIAKLEAAHRGD